MDKNKGYYVHFDGRSSIGVSKKIDMQLKELERFFDCIEIEMTVKKRGLGERILGLLPFISMHWDYDTVFQNMENPRFIYLRRTVADRAYIHFLQKIKKTYPECKIVVEIPTYPYDKDEFAKWNAWPFFIKDAFFRRKYKEVVDRFVTYSEDKVVFGVSAIPAMNGIDVSSVNPIILNKKENKIDLIAVAYMQKHHGYERMIKGLKDYYLKNPQREVFFHLVGEGPEKKKYRKMVSKWKLGKYVLFYGNKTGEELEKVYQNKDIAVVSLGMYKLNIDCVSVLKSREYLAKGIPMITGCDVDVFMGREFPYNMQAQNNNSNIDVDNIIKFYDEMFQQKDGKTIVSQIRKFAYENVDMPIVMKPIIDYILA